MSDWDVLLPLKWKKVLMKKGDISNVAIFPQYFLKIIYK